MSEDDGSGGSGAAGSSVRGVQPPDRVVAVVSPVMRVLLRSPLGRAIGQIALVDFTGRRSGRHFSLPVLWHPIGDRSYVFTSGSWRANFAGGAHAVVTHRGQRHSMRGILVTEPARIAGAFNELLAKGAKPGALSLRMPPNHRVTSEDATGLGRSLIEFGPHPA